MFKAFSLKENYNNSKSYKKCINLEEIIEQVPPDYYQKSNFLQRFWHAGKLRTITKLVSFDPETILDVGCASGHFLYDISIIFPNSSCTGVDIYNRAVSYGKKKYHNINFYIGDAHKLPFANKAFDLVLCTEVLEHVQEPEKVLFELKRVIKKDGSIIIELDSGSMLFTIIWFIWKKFRGKVWKNSHLHSFNLKNLEKLIILSGLSIKKKKKFNLGMGVAYLISK